VLPVVSSRQAKRVGDLMAAMSSYRLVVVLVLRQQSSMLRRPRLTTTALTPSTATSFTRPSGTAGAAGRQRHMTSTGEFPGAAAFEGQLYHAQSQMGQKGYQLAVDLQVRCLLSIMIFAACPSGGPSKRLATQAAAAMARRTIVPTTIPRIFVAFMAIPFPNCLGYIGRG
jgi:hypothetical protein